MCAERMERPSSRWSRLVFDGDEKGCELWETKFLGHLRLQGLKDTILFDPEDEEEGDVEKKAVADAELIQIVVFSFISFILFVALIYQCCKHQGAVAQPTNSSAAVSSSMAATPPAAEDGNANI
ncbi:hypothetical protein SRHO_G00233580 [Serrasalmus rhombeus]